MLTMIISVLYILYAFAGVTESLLQPVLQRQLLKSGFHRELRTVIRIPQALFQQSAVPCHSVIREILPSNVYVDIFQLKSLGEHLGFDYISPTLDIEKPEYTSRGFSVLIYKDTHMNGADLVVNVTLPIHLRYHKPSTDFTKFYLYNPELFIRCDRSDYVGAILTEEQMKCSTDEDIICNWKMLQYSTNVEKLTVTLPVGNRRHTAVVVLGTLFVTFGGCLYLILKVINTKIKND